MAGRESDREQKRPSLLDFSKWSTIETIFGPFALLASVVAACTRTDSTLLRFLIPAAAVVIFWVGRWICRLWRYRRRQAGTKPQAVATVKPSSQPASSGPEFLGKRGDLLVRECQFGIPVCETSDMFDIPQDRYFPLRWDWRDGRIVDLVIGCPNCRERLRHMGRTEHIDRWSERLECPKCRFSGHVSSKAGLTIEETLAQELYREHLDRGLI